MRVWMRRYKCQLSVKILAVCQLSVKCNSFSFLPQMVHDMGFIVNHQRNMTLKGLAAKITPQNAHLITQSDEKSRTMLFKALKRVLQKIRDNQVLCQLSVKPKANASCQLNSRLFVTVSGVKILAICQLSLTPSRPSSM